MTSETGENMAFKSSRGIIVGSILVVLLATGGFGIPASATTPVTVHFTGFSGFIDYGYSTTLSTVAVSPSYTNEAFQEYDIKYGASTPPGYGTNLPGKATNVTHTLPGTITSYDNLFANAMVNYHTNPPKPIADPAPNFTYHHFNTVVISFT
jgi:hypothetical protein